MPSRVHQLRHFADSRCRWRQGHGNPCLLGNARADCAIQKWTVSAIASVALVIHHREQRNYHPVRVRSPISSTSYCRRNLPKRRPVLFLVQTIRQGHPPCPSAISGEMLE
ncbi:hypothetical protein BDW22DRAFT_963918 [Trametopsis cervina]|nr:hypothetical protein BDW22DRAFT_963918 [Trametopsis cervina]